MAVVDVRDARKVYASASGSVVALDGVSLSVDAGEMVGLVGPSGCGKSTLLNLVGCVDLPTTGEVWVDGNRTTGLSDDELTALRRSRVGTVFQFFNLLPALTVEQNVALPLVLAGGARREIAGRVAGILQRVGLTGRAQAFPAEISGGESQRAAIARAVIHQPAIVLADEPTGNLDSKNGTAVLELLHELAAGGRAVLMATHSEKAAAVCDRIVAMPL
ncbi:MAG: ABC transporter ATP-binding protein [Candidatus Eremiobacteraeota bacterium]|nr:ABC transporter ATP-binding protein [Candidatus Eremiobacteraeota bacterium]MBV8354253.1 ABC transporter ATP-binding protein [Candidatus Eremiobacteraeota bacterium]